MDSLINESHSVNNMKMLADYIDEHNGPINVFN